MALLSRGVSAAFLAALNGIWHPVVLVYLDWPGSVVRYHSNAGTITWDGADWFGVGNFSRISHPGEGVGMMAERVVLTVVGGTEEQLDDSEQMVRNRDGAIYIGATTTRGGTTLVGSPHEVWTGYMDAMRFTMAASDGGVEHAIQLDLGSGPSARAVASVFHSFEDQDAKHPGDTAGRWLINIEKRTSSLGR